LDCSSGFGPLQDINDTYGHEAGDIVLKRVAEVLKCTSRKSEICGRIGGERVSAFPITHHWRERTAGTRPYPKKKLRESKFSFGGAGLTVTASFGVACFNGENARDLNQIISCADAALYTAKAWAESDRVFGCC